MSRKNRESKGRNKRLKWIVILLLILLLVGGGTFCIVRNCFRRRDDDAKQKVARDTNASLYSYADIDNNDGKNVVLPGYTTIRLPADTAYVDHGINFYNPDKNQGFYYMTFELKVGEESLYKSGLVAPGEHIQKINLKRALAVGEYDAIIFIQPYMWDESTPVNSARIKVKLEVLNDAS